MNGGGACFAGEGGGGAWCGGGECGGDERGGGERADGGGIFTPAVVGVLDGGGRLGGGGFAVGGGGPTKHLSPLPSPEELHVVEQHWPPQKPTEPSSPAHSTGTGCSQAASASYIDTSCARDICGTAWCHSARDQAARWHLNTQGAACTLAGDGRTD